MRTIRRGIIALGGVAGYGITKLSKTIRFDNEGPTTRHAICFLYPSTDAEVYGVISFSQENIKSPTKVVAGVRGLNPNSTYGLQLLEYGDLSGGQKTLGGSYSSINSGGNENAMYYKHSGDLGNIMTSEKGAAYSAFTNPYIQLFGENNVYGRSCGVFSEANDSATSLNKGEMIAAGVIGRSSSFKNLPPA